MSILARAGFPPDVLARTLPLLDPEYHQGSSASRWAERVRATLASWAEGTRGSGGSGARGAERGAEKGVARPAEEAARQGPRTHPAPEERMRRMRALARDAGVQALYRGGHSWWARQKLAWT